MCMCVHVCVCGQVVKALDCRSKDHRFKSHHHWRNIKKKNKKKWGPSLGLGKERTTGCASIPLQWRGIVRAPVFGPPPGGVRLVYIHVYIVLGPEFMK